MKTCIKFMISHHDFLKLRWAVYSEIHCETKEVVEHEHD
jgi:hypothetical protein